MMKLKSLIEVLERCSPEGCWEECPFYKEKDCDSARRAATLEVLKSLFADLVHANDEILARERTENELNVEIVSLRLKASDYQRKCVIARKERDEARMKVLGLEAELFKLRQMPNDWGEYPPEFPREGM